MNPDELWTRTLFLNAKKVAFCEGRYSYLRRKDSICTKVNAKSFDGFKALRYLRDVLIESRSGKAEMKIWKKSLLTLMKTLECRYIFCKHLLSAEDDAKVKEILRQGRKMAFRECWYDIRLYTTALKIKTTARRYKKYLALKKKLQKKGMVS